MEARLRRQGGENCVAGYAPSSYVIRAFPEDGNGSDNEVDKDKPAARYPAKNTF
jgi:hypothetical protein